MARGVVAKWPWPVGPESPEGFTRGGYIRRGVYCVQRSFPCVEPDGSTGTRRLDVSLRQTEPKAAYDELLRFLADPFNWKPAASPEKVVGLFLDRSLTEDFLAWSRDTRKNTEQWRREQRRVLAWWGERLAGVDLRAVTVRDHVEPALTEYAREVVKATGRFPTGARAQRIRILKSLYGWMVEKEKVDRNPLARKLRDETKVRPAQWRKIKAIPMTAAAEAYGRLPAPYSDALAVILATGWHARELVRFAESGSIESLPEGRETEGTAVLVTPRTKAGNPLCTIVADAAAGAARRLRERGELSEQYFRRALEHACSATFHREGQPRHDEDCERCFHGGQARHTVATYAEDHGAEPSSVARFLNHGSTTTSRFYSTHALPKKIPTPETEMLRRALIKAVPA